MPSRTTLPSAKFCCAEPRSARATPAKQSRQRVASAATYSLTRPASLLCLARDLTHAASSACSLPYTRIAENSFPDLPLGLIGPFLSQMIVVFLDHGKAGI